MYDLSNRSKHLVLHRVPGRNGLGRGVQIGQPPFLGLHGPLGAVAVAREDHVLVLLEDLP